MVREHKDDWLLQLLEHELKKSNVLSPYFLKKDIIAELPPFIMPNTGNMGLPICLFAYGTQGLGVAGAISSLIILFHFTLGVFLASKKFNFDVIVKSPAFYSVIISILFLYFNNCIINSYINDWK